MFCDGARFDLLFGALYIGEYGLGCGISHTEGGVSVMLKDWGGGDIS